MTEKRLLIRADDLGFCEAVNYGIQRAVRQGVVRSVGLLPNMEAAAHGVSLLEGAEVCYGMHTNLCDGRPLTDPRLIPSLVQPDGSLKPAAVYRKAETDFVVVEQAVEEIEAQLRRFEALTGGPPRYFELHSVFSPHLLQAMGQVAARHGLPFFDLQKSFYGYVPFRNTQVHTYMEMDSMDPRYDPFGTLQRAAMQPTEPDQCQMLMFHPGYIDDYVLDHTYITTARPREAAMLSAPATRRWLEENQVRVITFDDL